MLAQKAATDQDVFSWLKLYRSENVGPKTFATLLQLYGSAKKALNALPGLAASGGMKRKINICPDALVENELEKTTQFGAQIIPLFDERYPQLLKYIHDAPPILIAHGDITKMHNIDFIGIVGSRDASTNGCSFAKKIASGLAQNSVGVVSGLARGIDSAAHLASLNFLTVAVIAGGIDHIYPPENAKLFHSIAQQGVILTELPIGCAPLAKHFPQRNRLISGIAKGVAIIEAAKQSGTLITAKYAKSQGKQIFAVPGSPLDKRCGGTNQLLREGARLLESENDLLDFLKSPNNIVLSENSANDFSFVSASVSEQEMQIYRQKFMQAISYVPTPLEDILAQALIPISAAHVIILELELAGRIERSFGNKICLLDQL